VTGRITVPDRRPARLRVREIDQAGGSDSGRRRSGAWHGRLLAALQGTSAHEHQQIVELFTAAAAEIGSNEPIDLGPRPDDVQSLFSPGRYGTSPELSHRTL